VKVPAVPYPESGSQRNGWVVERRAERNQLTPGKPWAYLVEEERSASGEVVPVATIFLTNRECPWRCVMCDLWRNTLAEDTPAGAIPEQIAWALARLPAAREVKLYNSGSFFDRRAVPPEDHEAIAAGVAGFERVIVECHPSLVTDECLRFRDRLRGRLEVAMGLETAHPKILEKLNKRMTLQDFAEATDRLRSNDMDLRVFLLVRPPFMQETETLEWTARSLDFAFDCGATAATLIPTRAGNGAMEALAARRLFSPPSLGMLEAAAAYGIGLARGRVFADLWDAKRFAVCGACSEARLARLHRMNLEQRVPPAIRCDACGGRS
jgi:archaeosine synthase beta-subunit